MTTALYVTFTVKDPSKMGSLHEFAKKLNQVDGFLQKTWLHQPEQGKGGGFYLFASKDQAIAYLESDLFKTLETTYCVEDIQTQFWDCSNMRPLSKMTNSQIP
tara:strand:- start:1176 stop:1484 length:309 start_codon:yes stop_codon:yes gene_type:complete